MFFVVIVPVGFVMRMTKRDPLRRQFDRDADQLSGRERESRRKKTWRDLSDDRFPQRSLAIHAAAQEILAGADHRRDGAARRMLIVFAQGSAVAPFIYTLF